MIDMPMPPIMDTPPIMDMPPIMDTPDIEMSPGCGCMDLTHPVHKQMFPEKQYEEKTLYPGYQEGNFNS